MKGDFELNIKLSLNDLMALRVLLGQTSPKLFEELLAKSDVKDVEHDKAKMRDTLDELYGFTTEAWNILFQD